MRRLSILFAILGLCLAVALVAHADVGQVADAVLSVGWQGFAVLLLWQAGLFLILGLAWRAVLPGVAPQVLIWGRMVRDGATTTLPFSPVGGYVFGARAAALAGLPWPVAAAGTIVDVAAEITAQGLFALFGLAVLLLHQPDSFVVAPLALGLGAAAIGFALLVRFRRRLGGLVRGLVRTLGERLAGSLFTGAAAKLDLVEAELARLLRHPARFGLAVMLHALAWLGTGGATWLTLRLLGHEVDFITALAIEAVVHAMVGAAFLVPGGAGVQEAGYAGLGALFGIPAEIALGASLLRRAREAAWGIPVLLAWQFIELRRLRAGA